MAFWHKLIVVLITLIARKMLCCMWESRALSPGAACRDTLLRWGGLAELRFPHLCWIFELLPCLRLMVSHQNCPDFEDKCFCATVAACACKVYSDSVRISKPTLFSMAKHASQVWLKSECMEKRGLCTGGRRVGGAAFFPSEVNMKSNTKHMWPFGKHLCANASTTSRVIKIIYWAESNGIVEVEP